MHDAGLHFRPGPGGLDCLGGRPFSPSQQTNRTSLTPRFRSLASTPATTLAGGDPYPEHVLEPVDVHAGDQVGGLVVD